MNKLEDLKNKIKFKGVTLYKSKIFRVVSVLLIFLFVINFGSFQFKSWKYGSIYADNVGSDGGLTFSSSKATMGIDFNSGFKGELSSEHQDAFNNVSDMNSSVSENISEPIESGKEEKLVYTSYTDIETKDIEKALEYIHSEIEKYNGILQSENLSNMDSVAKRDALAENSLYRGNAASAELYVRIPQKVYKEFIGNLNEDNDIIVVKDISQKIDNMTDTYYDYEARLKSLRIQETRLLEFMRNANNVADMLSVEDRLSNVQYEIDRITNSINEIDNDVDYAKVTISIREVIKYTSTQENPQNFFERVISYFSGSLESFAETLEDWLAVIIFLIPYGVLLVIIVFIVKRVVRNRVKRRSEKLKEKENEISIKKEE